MKILNPILKYTTNDNLSNSIGNVIREFVQTTKVNFYTSEINIYNLDPEQKITIPRKDLNSFQPEFELFVNVWRMSLEFRINRTLTPKNVHKIPEDKSVLPSVLYRLTNMDNVQTNKHILTEIGLAEDEYERRLKAVNPTVKVHIIDDKVPEMEDQPSITFIKRQITPGKDEEPKDIGNDFEPETLIRNDHNNAGSINSLFESRALQNSLLQNLTTNFRRSLTQIREIKVAEGLGQSKVIEDEAVKELLQIEAESESQYKVMVKNQKMSILRKTEEGNPIVLIKSVSTVDGPADKIFRLIYDLNYLSRWDKVFSNLKIVKILNENTDVMYSYLKAPIFVTDRDFLQKRTCYKNYRNIDFLIAFKSWEDTDVPPLKNVIRSNTIISGYDIRSIGPNKTSLTVVTQTDIKGFIPKSFINAAAAKSPLDWIKRLETALNLFNE